MGIFSLFSKTSAQFVSPQAFERNRANQLSMTPATLEQLRKIGINPEMELKLEFFFYTNSNDKASALLNALLAKGYETQQAVCASDKSLQVVTGWTTKMLMSDTVVSSWTNEMCHLGLNHDCEFDGWGTTPSQ